VHPEFFVDVVVFVSSFGEKSFFTAGAATAATLEFGESLSQCVQPCGETLIRTPRKLSFGRLRLSRKLSALTDMAKTSFSILHAKTAGIPQNT
jgi:hypothetical protein